MTALPFPNLPLPAPWNKEEPKNKIVRWKRGTLPLSVLRRHAATLSWGVFIHKRMHIVVRHGISFQLWVGLHLNRPCMAVVAEKQFVALKYPRTLASEFQHFSPIMCRVINVPREWPHGDNGWLESFLLRDNNAIQPICGEANDQTA